MLLLSIEFSRTCLYLALPCLFSKFPILSHSVPSNQASIHLIYGLFTLTVIPIAQILQATSSLHSYLFLLSIQATWFVFAFVFLTMSSLHPLSEFVRCCI